MRKETNEPIAYVRGSFSRYDNDRSAAQVQIARRFSRLNRVKISVIMASKIKIADAGNVMVPAYLILKKKGYRLRRSNPGDLDLELWHAENATCEFVADGPVALLGLVLLYETRGENWQSNDEDLREFEDWLHGCGR